MHTSYLSLPFKYAVLLFAILAFFLAHRGHHRCTVLQTNRGHQRRVDGQHGQNKQQHSQRCG
ncbi:hypothetical protein CC86DRAFT_166638 [Ophiobolus disseminans]|uniref:Uncharacterized protein n=1 Tax=Ophiobolus disseminans TaxID=1469910 RepID=A0A6A7ABW3_9PLEO|nr:hypothetical protein CC86DRAFT_166638 [Ophiobolus disseminans]